MTSENRPPRVFISYSHDSDEHCEGVLELANRLRSDGVDAWLDRYEQAPPEGWPRWMQRQIEKADFILVVCTATYKRRFEGKEDAGKGRGATWEGLLAAQILYEASSINRKLVPILFDETQVNEIPLSLRPFTFWRLPSSYPQLYRFVAGHPEVAVPPLGENKWIPAEPPIPSLPQPSQVSAGLPAPETDSEALRLLTAEIERLRRAIGKNPPNAPVLAIAAFGFLLVAVLMTMHWQRIKEMSVVGPMLSRLTEKELPKATPGFFNLGLAHLVRDPDGEQERKLQVALQELSLGIKVRFFDRVIRVDGDDPQEGLRRAHGEARGYLMDSGFHLLLWGEILGSPAETAIKLYWTPADGLGKARSSKSFNPERDQTLPALFWNELHDVLGLVVFSSATQLGERRGHFVAEEAKPLVDSVRNLLKTLPTARGPIDVAAVRVVFANALVTLGEQSGDNSYLEEALTAYGEALRVYTREHAPLDWARTQNNLGIALQVLGERDASDTHLQEAVAAYRETLNEYTRERAPLRWAATQVNLANALSILGERQASTQLLEEAVAAYLEALDVYTAEQASLDWADTQNNLGVALQRLGGREAGRERLEAAAAAYRQALTIRTRERVPLDWAATQLNLGNALHTLGKREANTKRLREAISAYREAFKEYTRERLPLDWAASQHNLGITLKAIGELERSQVILEEALTACREALKERTRERTPLDWADTQNNLGSVLLILGMVDLTAERLEEAVAAFRQALKEYTRERTPLDWAATQYNLGGALSMLGLRDSDATLLEEAVASYDNALEVFTPLTAPGQYELTRQYRDRARQSLLESGLHHGAKRD